MSPEIVSLLTQLPSFSLKNPMDEEMSCDEGNDVPGEKRHFLTH